MQPNNNSFAETNTSVCFREKKEEQTKDSQQIDLKRSSKMVALPRNANGTVIPQSSSNVRVCDLPKRVCEEIAKQSN